MFLHCAAPRRALQEGPGAAGVKRKTPWPYRLARIR